MLGCMLVTELEEGTGMWPPLTPPLRLASFWTRMHYLRRLVGNISLEDREWSTGLFLRGLNHLFPETLPMNPAASLAYRP